MQSSLIESGVPQTGAPQSGIATVQEARTFPNLHPAGPPVHAKSHVAAGTGLWKTLAIFLAVVGGLITVASTLGVALLLIPLGLFVDWLQRARVLALLRGSNLEVGPRQLPQIYECARVYSERLGLAKVPDIYVAESNVLNAVAFRIGARRSIVLADDGVWGALHALGHTSAFHAYVRNIMRPLSRLDELSADAVALQLVGNRQVAYDALTLLTVGPQLMQFINRQELMSQAMRVEEDKQTLKAERHLTHPLLLRRLNVLRSVHIAAQ
jgi:Zn-dependent protease with chaperone function